MSGGPSYDSTSSRVNDLEISEIQNQSVTLLLNSDTPIESKLELLDWFLSVNRNRLLFRQAKCNVTLNTSRYLTNGNATMVEQDYQEVLNSLMFHLNKKHTHEMVCQRLVDSRIVWDVIRQNINLNESFPLPRPPMENGDKKEREIMKSMTSMADLCCSVEIMLNEEEVARNSYLDNLVKYIDQLEKFKSHKELQCRREQMDPFLANNRQRLRNSINKTNTVRGIVTNVIGNANTNYLDHPELVEVIRKCRNVVTENYIKKESVILSQNFVLNQTD